MAAAMTDDEHRQSLAEEGRAVPIHLQPQPNGNGGGSPLPTTLEIDKKAAGSAPPPLPPSPSAKSLAKAEEDITAIKKLCHAAKAKENREFGAFIGASAASMMVAWYFLSPDVRGAYNMRYIITMLLCLACLISGLSLMLLSQNILLREDLVVDVQVVASKWLSLLCSILPVLTLLSSLVLSGYKVYRYIGLIILGLVMAPLAFLRWYIGRNVEGSDEQVDNEQKEQLEAAFKFISAISNSAFAGLVALVVNYNIMGYSGHIKGAVLVAIFILFTAAILGLLSMEIRTKVLEMNNSRLGDPSLKQCGS